MFTQGIALNVIAELIAEFILRTGKGPIDTVSGGAFERALRETEKAIADKYDLDYGVFDELLHAETVQREMASFQSGRSFEIELFVSEFLALLRVNPTDWTEQRARDLFTDFFAVLTERAMYDETLAHLCQKRQLEQMDRKLDQLTRGSLPSAGADPAKLDGVRKYISQGNYSQAASTLVDVVPKLLRTADYTSGEVMWQNMRYAEFLCGEVIRVLPGRARLHLQMADVKHSLGEWQGALKHYEYAYKCAVTERDQLEAALRCGNMDLNFGNYVEATQRFLEVLRSPASTAEVDLALQAENFRGWIALYQGNHQLALCIFHGCLRNISSIGDPLLEATVWHFLGRTYHELGQHEEGIQMLRQAFTIEEREGANPRRLGHDYRWIAECQLGLGNEQRARELLLEASAIFQRESDPGGQAHIGVHQAKMILREGQPVAARELLLHSDAFWREIGYLRGVAECQYLTGCAYEAEGLHPHAAAAYLKAMRAYRKVRSPKCQAAFRALRRLRGILGDKQYQRIRRETE